MRQNKVTEATDVYNNVDFKSLKGSNPLRDNINVALLQDIQTAAKNANLRVDITTAITGHRPGTRHETGNAVDIAIINGKAVSPSNRGDADKLVNELIKLGYAKNVPESGNKKVVLTFGMEDHDTHVHVSNLSGSKSSTETNQTPDGTESSDDGGVMSDFANRIGKLFFPKPVELSLKEDIDRIKELLK
jgi:hypothetical protein